MPMRAAEPTTTPMPMPALAPVVRPVDSLGPSGADGATDAEDAEDAEDVPDEDGPDEDGAAVFETFGDALDVDVGVDVAVDE